MDFMDYLEIPVKFEKQNEFRNSIADTNAEIKNVVEISRERILLFIVDPHDSDESIIAESGFKTFLSEKGLEIYKTKQSGRLL